MFLISLRNLYPLPTCPPCQNLNLELLSYTLLTGHLPVPAVMRDRQRQPQPIELRPSINPSVNEAIMWGMAVEAKDRPQSIDRWLEYLLSPYNKIQRDKHANLRLLEAQQKQRKPTQLATIAASDLLDESNKHNTLILAIVLTLIALGIGGSFMLALSRTKHQPPSNQQTPSLAIPAQTESTKSNITSPDFPPSPPTQSEKVVPKPRPKELSRPRFETPPAPDNAPTSKPSTTENPPQLPSPTPQASSSPSAQGTPTPTSTPSAVPNPTPTPGSVVVPTIPVEPDMPEHPETKPFSQRTPTATPLATPTPTPPSTIPTSPSSITPQPPISKNEPR
ncbi:hypothetical protein ACQ4M3_29270 [Leptolyngbya sp. AN03gr2]|uniref:hypothetical protein n=1 Tax=unclassified Leptolyngbya TaxID=2650499 RepID=UPI003D31C8D0